MAVTDIIISVSLLLLVLSGAANGFFRSLLWPASTLASLLLSIGIFFIFRNLIVAIIVSFVSAFLIKWVVAIIAGIVPGKGPSQQLSPVSRFAGALLNLIWGSALSLVIVATLAIIPFSGFGLGDVSYDIYHSRAFQIIKPVVTIKIPPSPDGSCSLCSKHENQAQALTNDPLIQDLLHDPRMQKIQNDKALLEAIQTKNMTAILNNPTIQELRNDPAFLIKAMRVYTTMQGRDIE